MNPTGDDIVREFLIESYENLDQLDRDFVSLEQNPASSETLARVFRTVHTLKGTCGFLGYERLQTVAHAGEGVLSRLRDGSLQLTPELASSLLRMADAVRAILGRIETTGNEGDERYADIVSELGRVESRSSSKPSPAAPRPETDHEEESQASAEGPVADGNIRVDVRLLDRLVTLVSELVLARNQIVQHVGSGEAAMLPASAQRLNLITTELQEEIMKTRMQPIGSLWKKLPRQVRDVAAACGKSVRIEMEGAETELDRTVLEAIRDPLTHLVRNAIDHGIENPEIRTACGKKPEGRLLLRAYHEGGLVHTEISDDGAGLPIERIKRKALEKKLVAPERAPHFSDRDWANLIFTPGFSTAQSVTAISGRGVGMDVVKTHLERIGGTVEIQTRGTVGTTIFLRIPLTLAIVPALIVTDDGERFAIPQAALRELLRIAPASVTAAVEWTGDAPVLRLRGRLLPLAFLRELLNRRRPFDAESLPSRAGALHVAVLDADGRRFGLVVDEVNDAEEIVVKPLTGPLENVGMLTGATILGDGRVGLILDVAGIASVAGLPAGGSSAAEHAALNAERIESRAVGEAMLVAEARPGWRVAFPLAGISRLEHFELDHIERSASRDVVQYAGGVVPVQRLARLLDPHAPEEPWRSRVPAVMLERGDRRIALAVESLVDIVHDRPEPQPVSGRPGIAAAAVIEGRVVDLIDLDAVLAMAAAEAAAPDRPPVPDADAEGGAE